nr:M15 family metallopeptidase [uncultured Moraxella sp.]
MAFNNKQLLAVGAIVGGIVLLPVAFAMKDDIKSSNNKPLVQERQAQAQPTNHQSNANGTPTCEYYGVAGNAGFYHFKFPEASSSDLVTVNGYKVHQMAAGDLKRMIADARSQGVTLTIGSAFRSVDYQRGIVQRKKSAGQSISKIYYVSSPPGFSEHHTGLAIDFTPINHNFAKTTGYRWLLNNAQNYGFEQTFTPTYSRATGISEESWHWKYTKTVEAKRMLANGQCFNLPKSQWRAI